MKQTKRCPKCNSTDIIADAKAIDRGESNSEGELSVATFRTPEAWIFRGKLKTTVSAWVCCGCGYVEFYADDPRAIRQT